MGRAPDGASAKTAYLSVRLEPRIRAKIDQARKNLSTTTWVTIAIQEKLERERG